MYLCCVFLFIYIKVLVKVRSDGGSGYLFICFVFYRVWDEFDVIMVGI